MANPERSRCAIAIDGPAASGKSSVARRLAAHLGFLYVNTGAMYRAVTCHVLDQHRPLDAEAVAAWIETVALTAGVRDNKAFFLVDGHDLSPRLNGPRVNSAVSHVSAIPAVRRRLVEKQREYIREHDLVMEGRDIGSVVFPETPYKFYIDASPEIRSHRRAAQGLQDQIAARDHLDSSRDSSPLVAAADAAVIDSSALTLEEVVNLILEDLQRRGLRSSAGKSNSES